MATVPHGKEKDNMRLQEAMEILTHLSECADFPTRQLIQSAEERITSTNVDDVMRELRGAMGANAAPQAEMEEVGDLVSF